MYKRTYLSPEEKIQAVEEYLGGTGSLNQTAKKWEVHRSTFQKWLLNYEMFGGEGLHPRRENQYYSETLKRQAVELYLSGQTSEGEVCKKYRIRSLTQLEQWISWYHGQKGFHPAGGTRRGTQMTRNYEEQKAAVEYCITHGRNYTLTAVHFGLTYQQIYGWVHRYHAAGLEGLRNTRRTAKNKEFKTTELEFEMERALHQKLRQHRRQNRDAIDLSGVRHTMEYQIVKELHEEKKWPIYKLCTLLGVSRAAYYKWCSRTVSTKQRDDEEMAQHIKEIYQKQHGIPGYCQMKIILERRFGFKCNLKRVHRLMSTLGFRSVCRRKKQKRPKKTSTEYIKENILNREFSAHRPNEKWLTDVTELKYGTGNKAYLSAILDLYRRNIVAFSLGHSNNNALVFETFDQTLRQYPGAKPLLHSDRGTQYTSRSFRQRMKRAGIQQSMSKVGCCLDNAPMEGFWSILKSEMYYPNRFDDYESLYKAISEYIDFYNHGRYQKNLGCMTPAEFILSATGMDLRPFYLNFHFPFS